MGDFTRRDFIKVSSIIGTGVMTTGLGGCDMSASQSSGIDLIQLCDELLRKWGQGLLQLQITGKEKASETGAIACPACGRIHGRVGDAFYPFLFLADKNKDEKYLDAALMVYHWMENHVSEDDGSWVNEPTVPWKGITVFSAIGLAEALKYHGHILDQPTLVAMKERLREAGEFIHSTFQMEYGNINYPVTASYALSLIGDFLDIPKFRKKGRYFAHESLRFFTQNDQFIFGEGKPLDKPSNKGCFPVDLGYNVEESLPALIQYSSLTGDAEVLETTVDSLKTHMEFMLPDGGWDNSWGTRNFKWTYWGSRTSDGCQAFAFLSHIDPTFYKVALKNTELLNTCTKDNLLHGGPHYNSHGISPCVHHTFCHSKALATVLNHQPEKPKKMDEIYLSREKVYGVKSFKDIQTLLVSKGKFRATITGYDSEYAMKNGHASGGALSMLWHEYAGPIFSASMTEYHLMEKLNMQVDDDPDSMPLTPRLELASQSIKYRNISDLKATVDYREEANRILVGTRSKLVDGEQNSPAEGDVPVLVDYIFSEENVKIKFTCAENLDINPQLFLPVISKNDEPVEFVSNHVITIKKEKCILKISSDQDIRQVPVIGKRIFNFVPGFEAIPLTIDHHSAEIMIEIIEINL